MLLGSDYPFDMGPEDPVARVRAARLDSAHDDAILGTTTAELLHL